MSGWRCCYINGESLASTRDRFCGTVGGSGSDGQAKSAQKKQGGNNPGGARQVSRWCHNKGCARYARKIQVGPATKACLPCHGGCGMPLKHFAPRGQGGAGKGGTGVGGRGKQESGRVGGGAGVLMPAGEAMRAMVATSTLPSSGGSGKCGSQAQDAADVCGERGEEDDLDVDSWEHGRTTGSQYLGQRVRRALVDGPVTTLIDGTVVKWLPVR